jgi:hypothetical protein
MFKRLRESLTYANVMVTLLTFVVLGGGAYAALHLPKNSVRSKNIVNGQVKGPDVSESSLGVVPRAANGAHRIDFQHAATDPVAQQDQPAEHLLVKAHALTATASCFTDAGNTELIVSLTTAKSAYINHFGVTQSAGPPEATSNGRLLNPGDSYSSITNAVAAASFNEDQVAVVRLASKTITLIFHTEVNANPPPGLPSCIVEGTSQVAFG